MLVCKIDQVLSGLFKQLRYISEGRFPLLVFFFLELIGRTDCMLALALLGTEPGDPLDDVVGLGPVFPPEPVHPTGSPAAEGEPKLTCLLGSEAFDWQLEVFLIDGNWMLLLVLKAGPRSILVEDLFAMTLFLIFLKLKN